MSTHSEFDLIDIIKRKCRSQIPGVALGIGDDAAVINPGQGMQLLLTTDTLVEGVHFLPRAMDPFQLGRKALCVNLSDIAAMGGEPRFLLVALAIPESITPAWIEKFYDGLGPVCEEFSLSVVGGDISRSIKGISISITLVGEVEQGGAIQRKDANINDIIYTTGHLGDAGAGLELILTDASDAGDGEKLVERHLSPEPRVKCGRFLSKNGLANASIDLSDGLSSDIRQICEASRVGAFIFEEKLPVSKELLGYKSRLKNKILHYVLNGGEDYELLFTVPPKKRNEILKRWPSDFPQLTPIGEIVHKEEGVSLIGHDGKRNPIDVGGFDHFKDLG